MTPRASNQHLIDLAAPFGPQVSIERLIEDLNRIYHAAEAHVYDQQHPEIFQQLAPRWQAMLGQAAERLNGSPYRVLDFGCGTGFEASRLLAHLPQEQIEVLCCYDLSPEMLQLCSAKIGAKFPRAVFTTQLETLPDVPFNLLLTNSLIHHLPAPRATIRALESRLAPEAVWLAGHEPSARFYRNPECAQAYGQLVRRKYLDAGRYWERLRMLLRVSDSINVRVADEAHRQGLFSRQPPPRLVGRLVDAWVAHGPAEAVAGRGFDMDRLEEEFAPEWSLVSYESYAFMGDQYEGRLSPEWQARARNLAQKYPRDGANFCCIWQRRA